MRSWSRRVRQQLYSWELCGDIVVDTANAAPAVNLDDATGTLATVNQPPFEADAGALTAALQEVLDRAALRTDRMGEILTQVAVPFSYFAMVLNLQPGRHRFTYELMQAALGLSGPVVMQFKHFFGTRRPADHSPLIQPMILTPGHGSYPMGHATQSYILATVLQDPALATMERGAETGTQLDALAYRISENRVVAGVHYMDDLTAGQVLGTALGEYFLRKASANTGNPTTPLEWLWEQAIAEWWN